MKYVLTVFAYAIVVDILAELIAPHYPLFSPADWRETFMCFSGCLFGGYVITR
jgi:hypothetical protein